MFLTLLFFAQALPTAAAESSWRLIDKGGTIALAVLFLVLFVLGFLIPFGVYKDLKERCSKFEKLAEEMAELARTNAELAKMNAELARTNAELVVQLRQEIAQLKQELRDLRERR
jgi:uncharacterized protein HemX